MKTCSDCKCQFDEGENTTMCPSCQDKFNTACDWYRAMRNSVKDKSYKEQREAVNNFRAGYWKIYGG